MALQSHPTDLGTSHGRSEEEPESDKLSGLTADGALSKMSPTPQGGNMRWMAVFGEALSMIFNPRPDRRFRDELRDRLVRRH
jgi:hypothetical protein